AGRRTPIESAVIRGHHVFHEWDVTSGASRCRPKGCAHALFTPVPLIVSTRVQNVAGPEVFRRLLHPDKCGTPASGMQVARGPDGRAPPCPLPDQQVPSSDAAAALP